MKNRLYELIQLWLKLKQSKELSEGGFTLIEILIVIVIIGILSSLAIPAFLSQTSRAVESEARQNIPSINSAQEAEFANERRFGEIDQLEVSLSLDNNGCSQYYCYISTPTTGANGLAQVITTATPREADGGIAGYSGKVYFVYNADGNPVPRKLGCRAVQSSTPPVLATATSCPTGSEPI